MMIWQKLIRAIGIKPLTLDVALPDLPDRSDELNKLHVAASENNVATAKVIKRSYDTKQTAKKNKRRMLIVARHLHSDRGEAELQTAQKAADFLGKPNK